MGTKGRPKILSKWIQTRKYHAIPAIDNVEEYRDGWMEWWNSLQPEWRKATEPGRLPLPVSVAMEGDDLASLRKGGPSGLVTVLIGLKWWAGTEEEDNERWISAIEDVKDCLANFKMPTNGKKRKGETERAQGGKRRRT